MTTDSYVTMEPVKLHERILEVKAAIEKRRAEEWAKDVKERQERHERKWLRRLGWIGPLTETDVKLWYAESWALPPTSWYWGDYDRCNELLAMCKAIQYDGPPPPAPLEEFVFLSASDAKMLSRW